MATRVIDDKAPWIELLPSTPEHVASMECARCKVSMPMPHRIEVTRFVRYMRTFMKVHRLCQPGLDELRAKITVLEAELHTSQRKHDLLEHFAFNVGNAFTTCAYGYPQARGYICGLCGYDDSGDQNPKCPRVTDGTENVQRP